MIDLLKITDMKSRSGMIPDIKSRCSRYSRFSQWGVNREYWKWSRWTEHCCACGSLFSICDGHHYLWITLYKEPGC